MGYSQRIYYKEKDHKNIYYQGSWHDEIYYKRQYIWSKRFNSATGIYFYVAPPFIYNSSDGTRLETNCTCDPRRRFLEKLFNDPNEYSRYRSYCNDKYMITLVDYHRNNPHRGKEEIRVVRGCLDSKKLLFDEAPEFFLNTVGCTKDAFLIKFRKNDSYIWRIIDTSDYENITYKEVGVLPDGYGDFINNGIADFFVLGHQKNYYGDNGNLKFLVVEKDGSYKEHNINIQPPTGVYGIASCQNFCVIGDTVWLLIGFGAKIVLYKTNKNFSVISNIKVINDVSPIVTYAVYQSPEKVVYISFGNNRYSLKEISLKENSHGSYDAKYRFTITYSNFGAEGKTVYLDDHISTPDNFQHVAFYEESDGLCMPCFNKNRIVFNDERGYAFMTSQTCTDGYTYTYFMGWNGDISANDGTAIVIRNKL